MAELPSYFNDFLQNIRLTENQRDELKLGHEILRKRLQEDKKLAKIYVSDFLQGSYRRGTAVRPKSGQRSDVDIIVVTNINKEEVAPLEALQFMRSVLVEYYDQEKCTINGRSIGIEMSHVDLDVVLTAAPSESDTAALRSASVKSWESLEDAEDWSLNEYWRPLEERNFAGAQSWVLKASKEPEWKTQPLWIPDREALCWQPTHPLVQIQRTRDKNKAAGERYINVVKALKWWRRCNPEPKHPKGYPLEHIVFHCCPDGITSIAEGVTRTLKAIRTNFEWHVRNGQTPDLRDHGVNQNVLHRIEPADFAKFHEQASEAAVLAREALEMEGIAESAAAWRRLLGNEFPPPPEPGSDAGDKGGGGVIGGFSERKKPSLPPDGRFA